jgi:rubredoxin
MVRSPIGEGSAVQMEKYRCSLCGHVYDPLEGDAAQGIAPNTRFEDLPESWMCPDCGAPREQYEKM